MSQPVDTLAKRVAILEKRLQRLRNEKSPTYPRTNPANEPLGVEGQPIIGDDDVMYSYLNGVWQAAT